MKEEEALLRLQSLSPLPLIVFWHENKRSYLSYIKQKDRLTLRLHRLFLQAPSPVFEALISSILKKNRSDAIVVRKMAHFYFSQARIDPLDLSARGVVYDLQKIYDEIKGDFFSPSFDAAIGWSNRICIKKFRSITFGSYDRHRHQIRIHPLLDDPEVPLYFLQFLVYHEMLHAVCPSIIDERGFCRSHTAEFRKLEKKFPFYSEAKKWGESSLNFFKTRIKSHGRS